MSVQTVWRSLLFVPVALFFFLATLSAFSFKGFEGGYLLTVLLLFTVGVASGVALAKWLVRRPPIKGLDALLWVLMVAASLNFYAAVAGVGFKGIDSMGVLFLQAVILGVLADHRLDLWPSQKKGSKYWSTIVSSLFAVAFFVFISTGSSPLAGFVAKIIDSFLDIFIETSPALLLAYFFSGLLDLIPINRFSKWMGKGGAASRSLKGMAVGLPIPICSCGVVPLYQKLVEKQVPISSSMAFLIATPELGIDALIISLPLLGSELTVLRLVAAMVLATAVGMTVGQWLDRKRGLQESTEEFNDEAAEPSCGGNAHWLIRGLKQGFGEMVDSTGPWILLGLVIAAFLQPLLGQYGSWQLPSVIEVVLLSLIGIPLYICASGATPIVAIMIAQGFSPGAGIALLLAGPATNVTTFGVLSRLHGKKTALGFAVIVISVAITIGIAINHWLPTAGFEIQQPEGQHQHGAQWQMVLASVMAIIFLVSLARLGAKGLLSELFSRDHNHDHEDHCSHSH